MPRHLRPTRAAAFLVSAIAAAATFTTASATTSVATSVSTSVRAAGADQVVTRVSVLPTNLVDEQGNTWLSRRGFVGGNFATGPNSPTDIRNTATDSLYRAELYKFSSWSTSVPAKGTYSVTLKMRENYWSRAGQRIFTVTAEKRSFAGGGKIDVVAAAGVNSAYDLTGQVEVTDGTLNLDFSASVDHSVVSAIEVRYRGTSPATPTPTTSPTPTPTPTTPNPAPTSPTSPTPNRTDPAGAGGYGAKPVGSATYPVPAGAIFVAPTGSDSAAGTLASPLKTVSAAVARAADGSTVVLRAGVYREFVLIAPGHRVTVQPYPNEAVWFDGSRPVSGWQPDGSSWKVSGWTTNFDASPTYSRGAPDNTSADWRFVNPAHPMAANPDQVWINGVEQRQVASRAQVAAGSFYVDRAAKALYLGSSPADKTVEASVIKQAFSLRAPGTVLRGFGVRRYAPSVPDQGAVNSYFPSMTLDNLTVQDSSTGGVGLYGAGSTVRNSTVSGSGQLGIQGNQADKFTLDNVAVLNNNDEHFNAAPAAGGIKITASRGITLRNSLISNTDGHAFWADESSYDITATGNFITKNTGTGIFYELSSVGIIADNVVSDSGYDGISVRNSNKIDIWNNSVKSNFRALDISQDYRRGNNPNHPGHDSRRPIPDPGMTWVIADIVVRNNALQAGGSAVVTAGVEAYDMDLAASAQNITFDSNLYLQPSPSSPRWLVAWTRLGTDPFVYTDLARFAAEQGQERNGAAKIGNTAYAAPLSSGLASSNTGVRPSGLPSSVANVVGRAAGTKHLGAWF